ncbi:MAG TPA: FKBP-type peptidyl-prolyl cis-trans isomerase [Woeseiaceae bacterium]|nr:FKBP-type peptidyl-prolyl cis-trans isomerase [Woeseiaceae bacterium]
MNARDWILASAACALLAACGDNAPGGGTPAAGDEPGAATADANAGRDAAGASRVESREILPGLTARVLEAGSGQAVQPGDVAVVHYTGWLHDPRAANGRGDKFDSSVDRGTPFEFPVGAGRVIRGWDEGVSGMRIGETRELTIAPHLGYGERGAGPIPPNSTLVFEVELLDVKPGDAATR